MKPNKGRRIQKVIEIPWYCRSCWIKGISAVPKEEIDGFTLEGIRLKIQGLHGLTNDKCATPDVRLGR